MSAIESRLERGSATRLVAFAGLSALAAWRYAGVEARPPTGRVVAVTGVAVVAGTALMLIRAGAGAPRRAYVEAAIARVIVLVVLVVVALLATGIPAHLLRPAQWGRLLSDVHAGLQTAAATLWPYAGKDAWTRLDILLALGAVPLVAAAVAFWPARDDGTAAERRYDIRQVAALALLLTLYVVGVLDSNGGSATAEGVVLAVLIVGWLWLPGLRTRRVPATLAWLGVTGALAAGVLTQVGGGQAWLNYRAWNLIGPGAHGLTFGWDQTYGPINWSRSQRIVFTVSAPTPQLWKTTTLDRFDGLRFMRSGTDAAAYEDLPLPVNTSWYSFATFTIRHLSSGLLPAEQGATVGLNATSPTAHDPDGTARTLGQALQNGERYTVLSYVPRPTPSELRAAPRVFPPQYLRFTDFDLPAPGQSGLRLAATDPSRPGRFFSSSTVGAPAAGSSLAASRDMQKRVLRSPYAPMYRLARRLAAGQRSTYDVAIAIQRYLDANDTYGEQPPARRYPLESFLFADRIGYCQQFSGAMALMLRMDGIPARVAAGFLSGSRTGPRGRFAVRAVDAHSWVEVYFTGIGWVTFNPTPPRSVGHVQKFPLYTSERTVYPYAALAATVGSLPQDSAQRNPSLRRHRAAGAGDGPTGLLIAAVVALLGLLAPGVRWLRGHLRLRRSLGRDGELASRELVLALRRLGYLIPPRVTLADIERLVRLHGGPDAARYVQLLLERRYARGAAASPSLHDRRVLRVRLTSRMGLDARLRGIWALPPAMLGWGAGTHAGAESPGGP